jgi:putative transposase
MRTPLGYRKRLQRHDEPGAAHYLTFSCFHNQPFLTSERTCLWLVEKIGAAKAKHPFDLWAWVFMPDHVHMLILPRAPVGHILKAIKEPLTKKAVAWVKYHAPEFLPRMTDAQPSGRRSVRFWQPGGGYDRTIVSAKEVREKIGYIHGNPVRKKLVKDPAAWRWSSFEAWMRGTDEPLPLDRHSVPRLDS